MHPVRCCIIWYSTSQFHRKYYFGQEEEEMKLCLMILSVPWYLFNGLEHTAILSQFLTIITGNSSRLLRIRISAATTPYWFPLRHFRWKEFNPLVIWIWNQNIATSTIVGTSSHNKMTSHNSKNHPSGKPQAMMLMDICVLACDINKLCCQFKLANTNLFTST